MSDSTLARLCDVVPPPEPQYYTCLKKDPLRHRKKKGSHATPKYGLLFSASAGCLPCVRYWHEVEGVSLASASDNHDDWDVRSYASTEGHAEVVAYVDERTGGQPEALLPLTEEVYPASSPPKCTGPSSHTWSSEYPIMLAAAARDGCVECCRILIRDMGVSPHKNAAGFWGMSPMEEAKEGVAKGRRGCAEVVALMAGVPSVAEPHLTEEHTAGEPSVAEPLLTEEPTARRPQSIYGEFLRGKRKI